MTAGRFRPFAPPAARRCSCRRPVRDRRREARRRRRRPFAEFDTDPDLRRVALQRRRMHVGDRPRRTEFDSKNHWLIDRGDGSPAVGQRRDPQLCPPAQAAERDDRRRDAERRAPRDDANIVNYFKSRNIRVMVSIGGITYTDPWNQALAQNAQLLGQRAAHSLPSSASGSRSTTRRTRTPTSPVSSRSSAPTGRSTPTTRPARTTPRG